MDMGVILEGSSPGVKDAEETREISADVMLIGASFFIASEEALNRTEYATLWFLRMKRRSFSGTVKVSRKW